LQLDHRVGPSTCYHPEVPGGSAAKSVWLSTFTCLTTAALVLAAAGVLLAEDTEFDVGRGEAGLLPRGLELADCLIPGLTV
jgi:hypothetical protein